MHHVKRNYYVFGIIFAFRLNIFYSIYQRKLTFWFQIFQFGFLFGFVKRKLKLFTYSKQLYINQVVLIYWFPFNGKVNMLV